MVVKNMSKICIIDSCIHCRYKYLEEEGGLMVPSCYYNPKKRPLDKIKWPKIPDWCPLEDD